MQVIAYMYGLSSFKLYLDGKISVDFWRNFEELARAWCLFRKIKSKGIPC